MSRTSKSAPTKKESSPSADLLDRVKGHLNGLLTTGDSEAFETHRLKNLAEDLDGNPTLAALFFEKGMAGSNALFARLLLDLNPHCRSKSVHKGIKRTLYRLEQKGIELPRSIENQGDGVGKGVLREVETSPITGYLSEFDGARNRMLALLIPKVSKGKLFLFALLSPDGGLENLTALEVNKKEAKEILGELEEHSGHPFWEADPGHVAFVLKEAHDHKSNLSKEDEGIFGGIFNLLNSLKSVGPAPIIRSLFPRDLSVGAAPLALDPILAIPEVFYYQLEDEVIDPYRTAVRNVQEGILIVSPVQKREQIREIIEKACREIFQDSRRTGLIRYLEEVAYLYFLKGQSPEARALYNAAQLGNRDGESVPVGGNSLLLWLVEMALLDKEEMEDPSDQTPASEITEGGIIIPPWVKREG